MATRRSKAAKLLENLNMRTAIRRQSEPKPSVRDADASNVRVVSQYATGLSQLAERYDLFLVDQWGVLHDGQNPFPGVRACLRRLMEIGKQVVILSNSGKPAPSNMKRLAEMGIEEAAYTELVTSGDVVRDLIARRDRLPYSALGSRCLFWGSEGGEVLLKGMQLQRTDAVSDADFILLAGVTDFHPLSHYERSLRLAVKRRIPLVCANPDVVRFSKGELRFSAGEVARLYQDMGGTVHFVGKPHPAIYDYCFRIMGGVEPERTLAIGDSLSHDVLGGARAGVHTAFVCGGIHHEEFEGLETETRRLGVVARLGEDVGVQPHWVVPLFRW
jgi:HAD superfamily hydrolase (TIGR01459 family)